MTSDRGLSLVPVTSIPIDFGDDEGHRTRCDANARYHCAECFAFLPTTYAKAAWDRARWSHFGEYEYDGPICPNGQGCNRPDLTSRAIGDSE